MSEWKKQGVFSQVNVTANLDSAATGCVNLRLFEPTFISKNGSAGRLSLQVIECPTWNGLTNKEKSTASVTYTPRGWRGRVSLQIFSDFFLPPFGFSLSLPVNFFLGLAPLPSWWLGQLGQDAPFLYPEWGREILSQSWNTSSSFYPSESF